MNSPATVHAVVAGSSPGGEARGGTAAAIGGCAVLASQRIPFRSQNAAGPLQSGRVGTGAAARGATRRINGGEYQMVNSAKKLGTTVVPATTVVPITDDEFKEAIAAKVLHISTGRLAKATQRTKDAAKLWKSGERVPNAPTLINLARNLPAIREWVVEQCGGETNQNAASVIGSAVLKLAAQNTPEGEAARQILALVGGVK